MEQRKVIKEKDCVRRIRFSTTMETTAENDDSIIVYARMRPSNDPSVENAFVFTDTTIKYCEKDKYGNEKLMSFSFHKVFSPEITQDHIFSITIDSDMDLFISGKNRLIFAYGTTSSGKTYTIHGNSQEPGILPRCSVKLFMSVQERIIETRFCPDQGEDIRTLSDLEYTETENHRNNISQIVDALVGKMEVEGFCFGRQNIESVLDILYNDVDAADPKYLDSDANYAVWVTYVEIYNENIYDLLSVDVDRKPLKLGIDSLKNNYIKGLHHIRVSTWIDMWKIFLFGRSRLHTHQTQLNKSSSRSHSVFTIKLMKIKDNWQSVSSFRICDLAGAERQKKALNVGETLIESRNINTSLMMLNRCFSVIRENKVRNQKKIPPFRDSKLTMIFQKAFSYGEPITMYVNLSQNPVIFEESKHVLKVSAVAQEMVKMLPKKMHKFVKPNSRFSILCANPNEPFQRVTGHSGVLQMESDNGSSSFDNETIKSYESRIKALEDEKEKQAKEIKDLLQMLEDARIEYLHMEEKNQEAESKLSELLIENDDLSNDWEDLNMLYEAVCNSAKITEDRAVAAETDNKTLTKQLNEEMDKVASLTLALREMEEELQKSKQQATTSSRKPLLKAFDHLDDVSVNSDSFFSTDPPSSTVTSEPSTKPKTPRTTRKCKK